MLFGPTIDLIYYILVKHENCLITEGLIHLSVQKYNITFYDACTHSDITPTSITDVTVTSVQCQASPSTKSLLPNHLNANCDDISSEQKHD